MAAPSTPVLDAFTGAAGTLLTTYDGTDWGAYVGLTSLQIAASGTAVSSASYGGHASYWKTSFGPDCDVYATLITLPANALSLTLDARITNPTNGGTVNRYSGRWTYSDVGSDTFAIVRTVAGADTTIATDSSGSYDLAVGDKMWLNCTGTTITFYRYNSGTTTWQQVLQATDANVTGAGNIAIYLNGANNHGTWDDFGGGTVVAGAAGTGLPSSFLSQQAVPFMSNGRI